MSDELNVMRGEPVKIIICGKEVVIKRLTITRQLEMIDIWKSKGAKADKGLKQNIAFMQDILVFVTGIDNKIIEKESTIIEIGVAFQIIYDRELLPLLKGVGNLLDLEVPGE